MGIPWFINKCCIPLTKNVLTSLVKNVLLQLELTVATSATDRPIRKKIYGSGIETQLISNEETDDNIKILKSLEESGLLIQGVSETIQNEEKEQKDIFLCMLQGILGAASLLGTFLKLKYKNEE